MILEWLAALGTTIAGWVADLFPDWEMPPELADPYGMIQTLLALGSGFAPFVDWGFAGIIAGVVIGAWVIGLLVRMGRVLIGHSPVSGGNG